MDEQHANDPPWLDVAKRELGTKECVGPETNPRIAEYFSHTGLGGHTTDDVSWCSAWMCFVMDTAGYRSTRRANARSWSTWGTNLVEPKRGCVVVFWRGDLSASTGHVALFMGSPEPGKLTVLGGNQNNEVGYATYGTGRVLSYRWPKEADRIHSK